MTLHASLRWLFFSVIFMSAHDARTADLAIPLNYLRLDLPNIPKLCFRDQTPIRLKSPDAYEKLINRWQEKLNAGAIKLFATIENEIHLTPEQLFAFAQTESVLNRYCTCKKAEMMLLGSDDFITEDKMTPEVLAFLQNTFSKYSNKQNVTFYITHKINTLTAVHGCDAYGYHIFLHSFFYNKNYIQQYYRTLITKNSFYYIEKCQTGNDIRWISIPTFLHIGIIEAAAYTEHQKNLIGFILSNYSFHPTRSISKETINLHLKLETFHSLLSGVFQSTNPLETAVFLLKNNHKHPEHTALWKAVVKDIAATYSDSSLKKMKALSDEIRKSQSQSKN